MSIKCFNRAFIVGVQLALGLVLGAGSAVGQAQPATVRLIMPTPPSAYLLPFFIANDLGYYEKAGVKLDEKVVTGDVNSMRAVLSRDGDVAYIGPGPIMQSLLAGAKVKIIASFQPVVDYRVVARTNAGSSIADLGTKRWAAFGPGGMSQAIPRMVMKKNNVDFSKAEFLAVGGEAARLQAVLGDRVDATIVSTYFAVKGVQSGQAKKISDVATDFPGLGYIYAVVQEDSLTDPAKRKALQAFITASIQGTRVIIDNPDQAAAIFGKRLNEADVGLLKQVLVDMTKLGVWGLNGGLDRNVFDFTAQTYLDLGEIAKPVKYEELIDPSLVQTALKELGERKAP